MVGDCSASGIAPASVEPLAAGFDLVVFGLRVERQRPRRGEPLVAGGELLVADQRVLGADEIVLRLVDRERILGVAQPFLQFLEPAGQVAGRAPRGGRPATSWIRRDRPWRSRWRASPPWPGRIDQTSMSTMKVRSVFLTLMWRIRVSSAAIWPSLASAADLHLDPEQAEQRGEQALGVAAAEFRILVELGVLDHLQQHAVRGDQPRLAFDHHGEAG